MDHLHRREVLRLLAGGAAGAALSSCASSSGSPAEPYAGFRMGLQSFAYRRFGTDALLSKMKELGIATGEFFPKSHFPVTADRARIEEYKAMLAAAGVAFWGFGVMNFFDKHEENRKLFEFARAMGAQLITAVPRPESFESISALTREYGVRVAIHNYHPTSDRALYVKLEDSLRALEKLPPEIGACVDTGHYLRAGEDPVRAIRALGSRIYEVHLKDAESLDVFTLLGEGKLRVPETLRALRDVKFKGCLALEYELKPEDPTEDLRACLATVRAAARSL